jgi:outer membrane protein OmpA-like peptidoglycan-associated protein
MRVIQRAGYVLVLSALFVQAATARPPAGTDDSNKTASSNSSASAAASPAAPAPSATSAAPAPAATPDQPKKDRDKNSDSSGLAPMPATSGTIGLFTVSTAETLPRNGFMVSGYLNRFGRMPGSVDITESGINVAYGATDWLTIFANFIPGEHVHVNDPGEITPIQTNGFLNYNQPFYVEDYPYASETGHGTGPVTVGAEFGLVSERRGAPLSVAVSTDFLIPTRQQFAALAADGTQSGEVNWDFDINVSKDFYHQFVLALDSGVRMVRDPVYQGQAIMAQARQWNSGVGLILFPTRRIQFMNEYSFEVFFGHSTPDDTIGPRDPVDAIWGLRLYPAKWLAIDAGYRYMLNLYGLQDRNGFVFKVAASHVPYKAPPVNHPPTASCSADKSSVFVDSGDTVAVTSQASDPDGDTLTYNWTATGGQVDGTGPAVHWLSAGTVAGTYTVTLKVDDGRGGTATCGVDVTVAPKPIHQPTLSCSVDRSSVFVGERVHITSDVNNPDGVALNYKWSTNGGQVIGTGPAVDVDTTGAAPGTYTVTGRVDDGGPRAADCSVNVEAKAVPPPPQASKLNECLFSPKGSPRVDNVCKRILDDVALRLQNDPHATAVIVGYADPAELHAAKLAGDRAANTVKYLGEKGIDASRLTTRTGTGMTGAGKENMRIDIIWVPEGATY